MKRPLTLIGYTAAKQKIGRFAGRNARNLSVAVILLCVLIVGVAVYHSGRRINGSPVCISWVKKIEGAKFKGIYSLDCSLGSRKIANSNLGAWYLDFTGMPKDGSICEHLGDSLPEPADGQYCVGWRGIVLSNGQTISGIGDSQVSMPIEYDYCYSGRINQTTTSPPTVHDLYYYNGSLYNRDVFKNTVYKTRFGTCLLNGTTLYQPDQVGNDVFITNVKITYQDFPKNCEQATIGWQVDESLDCDVQATMANANLDNCYNSDEPIVKNGVVTGYKHEPTVRPAQYTNGDCENAYVQRMAALNQCAAIVYESFRDACYLKVAQPFPGVTRVEGAL